METIYTVIQEGEKRFKINAFVSSCCHVSITKYGIKIPVKTAYLQEDISRNTINCHPCYMLFQWVTNLLAGTESSQLESCHL